MGEGPTRTRHSAKSRVRYYAAIAAAAVTGAGVAAGATAASASAAPHTASSVTVPAGSYLFRPTATPIKRTGSGRSPRASSARAVRAISAPSSVGPDSVSWRL